MEFLAACLRRGGLAACALAVTAWAGAGAAPPAASAGATPAVRVGPQAETAEPTPAPSDTAGVSDEPLQELPSLRASTQPDRQKTGTRPTPVAGEETKPKEAPSEKAPADDENPSRREPFYSAHEQGTVITQVHGHFRSPYIGPNSLRPVEPMATTETATLYLDARLWRGSELIFDPEISGGRGFSGTTGVAGFPNGEATRVGVREPTPYIARLFWRGTWGLGGEREKVEDDANQIAGIRDVDRLTLSVGKMSAVDLADNNRYSHDPRTQFMNWALMYNGGWDYPANVRGYTYGIAVDLNTVFWALRYGIFAEPAVANGAPLDPHFLKANGQILELEEHYRLGDLPGRLREEVYLNHAHMGNYAEALAAMPVDPDITLTRAYRFKYGFGLNLEQQLTGPLGFFARAGWNDGHSESWAFTEIDRTVAAGLLLHGKAWRRPDDQVGLAGVVNGLSRPHRDYLAAGGLGFIIGDGRLNYAPEQILELYYNCQLAKGINVTADFQGINHPAYNADRGPVAVGSVRVHFEH